tara:strand:- start:80 stop:274 length:195 start_codon:yes stop_codon:yes gene_type:complete
LPQCAPVASEVGERDKRCCFVEELGAVVRPLDLIEVEGVLVRLPAFERVDQMGLWLVLGMLLGQ